MAPSNREQDVFCICKRPDDGSWMIACEKCDEWFHGRCIGLTQAEGELAVLYYCDECQLRFGLESQWKPKCRLQTCFEPAKVAHGSKYCCTDHGIAYFRNCISDMAGISKDQLVALTNASGSRQKFKSLGVTSPDIDLKVAPDKRKIAESEAEMQKVYEAIAFLDECKEKKRLLSQEATEAEGAKREICAFNPQLSDPSCESAEVCMLEQRKCTQHKQWTVVFHERLFIKQQRIEKRLNDLQNHTRGLSQVVL